VTENREGVPPVQYEQLDTTMAYKHLLRLAHGANAKAQRSRRLWHRVMTTQSPEAAVRVQQQMLKHLMIAHHLAGVSKGQHGAR
jgi:hypothetical protein